jgi:hypothetical protein
MTQIEQRKTIERQLLKDAGAVSYKAQCDAWEALIADTIDAGLECGIYYEIMQKILNNAIKEEGEGAGPSDEPNRQPPKLRIVR